VERILRETRRGGIQWVSSEVVIDEIERNPARKKDWKLRLCRVLRPRPSKWTSPLPGAPENFRLPATELTTHYILHARKRPE
jgi:hypothetical protein